MKKLAIFLPLVVTTSVHAAQCRVDIKNEVRLDGEVLEIHQTNGDKAWWMRATIFTSMVRKSSSTVINKRPLKSIAKTLMPICQERNKWRKRA